MRAGKANPKKAPRPDLNVFVGSALIHVEAKILKPTGAYPRNYVTKGMRRFVKGHYDVDSCKLGAMVGYIIAGPSARVVDAVNAVLRIEAGFGASAALTDAGRPGPGIRLYASDHGKFSLHHQTIDLHKHAGGHEDGS
jgi:hypothetical protein